MNIEETSDRGHVAVIDDEPLIGDIIQRALRREYDVDVFLDADAALSALAEGRRYDLIFCDLRMPHMTGRDIYERLQEQWPDQARRMVFMSGLSRREAREEMLSGVENDMIKKPFELHELRTKAHQMGAH